MRRQQIVGVDYSEGPPVPIPNTEVKLVCADDTWLETARDNRLMPTQKEPHLRFFFIFRKTLLFIGFHAIIGAIISERVCAHGYSDGCDGFGRHAAAGR